MKAMILAAGKSERLKGFRSGMPKVMLPVLGYPILQHNLQYLKRQGIRQVFINLHYRAEDISKFLAAHHNFGLKIHLSYEDPLLGTAGALNRVRKFLKGADFLVLYGDNLLDFSVRRLLKQHKKAGVMITLGVYDPRKTYWSGIAGGLVKFDRSGRILAFVEKRSNQKVDSEMAVNAGILLASPRLFKYLKPGRYADFGKHIFPLLLRKKIPLQAVYGARYVLASDHVEAWKRTNELGRKCLPVKP